MSIDPTNTQQPATESKAEPSQNLERLDDDALGALITRAQALLEQRDKDRKRAAITQIKELAKAHGLHIAIEPQNTKRGRKQRRKANS